MYRLLIVDDEYMTRYGLIHLFDWSEFEVEVVGEADDGATALPLLEKLHPDILFTDVKMPHMDGISLANRAREQMPDLKIVFISGYNEIEYVRSALKVGAFDYILKPVDYGEVEQCFRKVVKQIEGERMARTALRKMEDRLSAGLHTMKEHFLVSLLNGQAPSGERLRVQAECLELRKGEQASACALLLSPDEGEADACRGFQNNWPLLNVALKNIAAEILEESFQGCVIDDPFFPKQLVCILFLYGADASPDSLYALCARIQSLVKKHLGLSVSLGIGRVVETLPELRDSYDSAAGALKHRLYLGKECIVPFDFGLTSGAASSEETVPEGSLRALLLEEEEERLRSWLAELFDGFARLRSTDVTLYRNKISRYIFEIHTILIEELGEGEEGELSEQSVLDQLFHSGTLEQMRQLVWQYCSTIRDLIRLKNDTGTKGLIQQVQKRIREQYRENVTVSELAASVYLTPTYLCLLFRQATGMTINHYQTMVRMEKAKELLRDLSNKLYDVSYAVGYMNPSYFSRQFKKYTGCLPSEYRDKLMSKEGC